MFLSEYVRDQVRSHRRVADGIAFPFLLSVNQNGIDWVQEGNDKHDFFLFHYSSLRETRERIKD